MRIPFVMGYDVAAIETMEEKRALLSRAAAERAWIVLEHDPLVAMGRPKAAVGATRSRSTFTEPRRTPAQAAVQAANVVGGGRAILMILNQSPGGIADNVQGLRTGPSLRSQVPLSSR